jgi:hypothetical protein
MQCPVCGGSDYVVESPNLLHCTAEVIVDAVPMGYGGNLTGAPIPIRGQCGATRSEQEWRAAAEDARARAEQAEGNRAERARLEREAQELAPRIPELLGQLKARNNPGLQPRKVPGRFHDSLADRLFGRVGRKELVEVGPGWRFGTCTWWSTGMRGVDVFENLPTGITPAGKYVPMDYAADHEDVHILFRKRSLWEGIPYAPQNVSTKLVSEADVVRALEAAAR